MNPSDLVYSTEALNFIKTAGEFCNWVEESDISDRKEVIDRGMRVLPLLYSHMLALPELQPFFEEGNEKFVTEQDWSQIYQRFSVILGSYNEYSNLAKADEYDRSETVLRYISEDIADIYQDIKDCIENYRIGAEEVMNDALWECHSGFENHWGEKSLRAAIELHKTYYSADVFNDENYLQGNDGNNTAINTDNWFLSKRQQEFRDDNYELSE